MEHEAGTWIDAGCAQALQDAGRQWAWAGSLRIGVFRDGEAVHALEDSCPHAGASLCSGRIDNGHVQCPGHGLRFNLASGRLAGAPVGTAMAVRSFPVRIVDGRVEILVAPDNN